MIKKIGFRFIFLGFFALIISQLFTLATVEAAKPPVITGTNQCVGLNYHRVRQPTFWNKMVPFVTQNESLKTYSVFSDDFAAQLDTLVAAGAYFATPDELLHFQETNTYPEKCVWISFDDVDETVFNNAFPLLEARQIPFTLFVISGHVGEKNFNNLAMTNWDELRTMRDSGLATFGSHTHDMHYLEDNKAVFLAADKHAEFAADLELSKKTIEHELAIAVTSIAYPFGETDDTVTEIVRGLGFTNASLLSPNTIKADGDAHYQNRYVVSQALFESTILPWLHA